MQLSIVFFVIVGVAAVWLIFLTIVFWQLYSHYNRLVRGITQKTLKAVLEEMMQELETAKKDIDRLEKRCDTIEKEELLHIQKIGLLRFNPFKDTGGDQSFILSLVDGNNTGVVISGLYSRSGTRWYTKRVVNGKGVDYDLSDEEKQALREAKKTNLHDQ